MWNNPFEQRHDGNDEDRDPFGRVQPKPMPEPEISNLGDASKLSCPVGEKGKNDRRDVAKVETMLGRTGVLDLKKTDGPTGYWGERTKEATRKFQKQHNLKVDGRINPGGETIRTLAKVADHAVKALARNDRHAGEADHPDRPIGVSMDEHGQYHDANGKPVSDPAANPHLKKAQLAPPIPGAAPLPGRPIPASPEAIDKALKDAGKHLEELARDPAFLKSPLGTVMIMRGMFKGLHDDKGTSPRADVAPKLPDREEFPARPANPKDGILKGRPVESDRAVNPPPYEPPVPSDLDTPPFEDQREEIEQIQTLYMGRKRDLKQMDAIAKKLGMDRKKLGVRIHAIKDGQPGDVDVDTKNGDVYDLETQELIGNVYDEY